MKRVKLLSLAAATLLTIGLLAGCGAKASFDNVPEEVSDFAELVLSQWQENGKNAISEYYYIIDPTEQSAFDNSTMTVQSYDIVSMEKINDDLYALTVDYVNVPEDKSEEYTEDVTAYNFIGKIDGQWRYIFNKRNIPEEIQENFDPDKYIYTDPDYLE